MCKVARLWRDLRADQRPDLETSVIAMAAALSHRGPDDAGVWSESASGVALAHQRLAILDLSAAGHQPMASANGRYVIALNGEIYNHLALRRSAPTQWRHRSALARTLRYRNPAGRHRNLGA